MRTALVIVLCSLILVLCPGCQRKGDDTPEEPQKQEQQEVDLEVLQEEYRAILKLIDNVLFSVTDEEITFGSALDALAYIESNRITPTQPQTIELDEKLDELLNLGFEYFLSGESEKQAIQERITDVLNEMQEIMIEIEKLLIEYNEV